MFLAANNATGIRLSEECGVLPFYLAENPVSVKRAGLGVMRTGVTLATAIISAIALLTAWSIAMLPRARDVVAAIQSSMLR
jgi:hypothetical protein